MSTTYTVNMISKTAYPAIKRKVSAGGISAAVPTPTISRPTTGQLHPRGQVKQ